MQHDAMTEEQLKAIEARAAAATAGPWECEARRDGSVWISMGNPLVDEHLQADWEFGLKNGFATHAREDVPALVAEVRRLMKVANGGTE